MIVNDLLVGYSTGGFVTGLGKVFLKNLRDAGNQWDKKLPAMLLGATAWWGDANGKRRGEIVCRILRKQPTLCGS
jgi:hypothetical protein